MIPENLKTAIKFCGPNLSFETKDIPNQYLRATGAMALLCSGVNIDTINITDRWCSN